MRRLRVFLAATLCLSIIMTLGISSKADDGVPTLDDIINAMVNQINELTAQVNILTEQLSIMQSGLSAGRTNPQIVEQQINEAAVSEKHVVRVEYGYACLLQKKIELTEYELSLADKRIEVENVKLSLGETTQSRVDVLAALRLGLEQSLEASREMLKSRKAYIAFYEKTFGYGFIEDYNIPNTADARFDFSLSELQRLLIGNNVALQQYNEQISSIYSTTDVDGLAIEQINTQKALYEDQLCRHAADRYSAYLNALARYKTSIAMRPVLESQLIYLDDLYSVGEISELELLEQRYSIHEELYNASDATMALMLIVEELTVMTKGVVVN